MKLVRYVMTAYWLYFVGYMAHLVYGERGFLYFNLVITAITIYGVWKTVVVEKGEE